MVHLGAFDFVPGTPELVQNSFAKFLSFAVNSCFLIRFISVEKLKQHELRKHAADSQ